MKQTHIPLLMPTHILLETLPAHYVQERIQQGNITRIDPSLAFGLSGVLIDTCYTGDADYIISVQGRWYRASVKYDTP